MAQKLPLWSYALGIYACNLVWAVFQERIGATHYGAERFKAVVVVNLIHAAIAAIGGYVALQWTTPVASPGAKAHIPFTAFFPVSFTHTLASPLGYSALRFIAYPLMVLVSSCKLVPVMLAGMILNGRRFSAREIAAAACMTAGVLVYSWSTPTPTHKVGTHTAADVPVSGILSTAIGVSLVCTNLMLEGYTNAGQDRLYRREAVAPFRMMSAMNAWT